MQRVRALYAGITTVVIAVLSGCSGVMRDSLSPPQISPAEEVATYTPVVPDQWTLSNGLKVIYLRDDELPIVRGMLLLRAGALWADRYPLGTTSAMGENMRLGGAGGLSADALDKELEKLAARVESSFSAEFGNVAFSCLSSDLERVFELFSDVALRPRYESDRLSLWKGQALEGIRRRVEDPGTVAALTFTQLVYNGTPYGRVSRSSDITQISRAQLVELHDTFVRPNGAILVVTGRVDRDVVAALTERHFGSWQPRGSALPPPPPVPNEPKPGIYFIQLPFAQASVKIGHLGVPRFTPDYPAIDVFNELFGAGGFGSRLMKRVRTDLGLSYGISGGIMPGLVRGSNAIFLQTKADSVVSAVEASIGVLHDLQSQEAQAEELAEKKSAIENSYVFNFGSAGEIAGRVARQMLLNYPTDYDATYLAKIREVTPNEVRQVAQARWDPSKFVIVVVGNEAAYTALEKTRGSEGSRLRSFDLIKLRFDETLVMQ